MKELNFNIISHVNIRGNNLVRPDPPYCTDQQRLDLQICEVEQRCEVERRCEVEHRCKQRCGGQEVKAWSSFFSRVDFRSNGSIRK